MISLQCMDIAVEKFKKVYYYMLFEVCISFILFINAIFEYLSLAFARNKETSIGDCRSRLWETAT